MAKDFIEILHWGLTNNIPSVYPVKWGIIVNTGFTAITSDVLLVALSEFQASYPFRSVFIDPPLINPIPFLFKLVLSMQWMSICNVERGDFSVDTKPRISLNT